MKFWHWQGLYVCLWCGAITVGMSNGYLIAWDLSSSQTQVRCTETPLYLFLSGNPLPSNHHSCWGEPLRACTWFVTSAASHSVTGALHSFREILTATPEFVYLGNRSVRTGPHAQQWAVTRRTGSDSGWWPGPFRCTILARDIYNYTEDSFVCLMLDDEITYFVYEIRKKAQQSRQNPNTMYM